MTWCRHGAWLMRFPSASVEWNPNDSRSDTSLDKQIQRFTAWDAQDFHPLSFLALYEMSASSVSPLGGGHLRSINQRWQNAKSRIDVWRWKWKYLWLVFPWHGHLTNVTILKVSVGKLFRKFSLVISIHSHSQFNPNSLLASTDLAALLIYAMLSPQQNLKNQRNMYTNETKC